MPGVAGLGQHLGMRREHLADGVAGPQRRLGVIFNQIANDRDPAQKQNTPNSSDQNAAESLF